VTVFEPEIGGRIVLLVDVVVAEAEDEEAGVVAVGARRRGGTQTGGDYQGQADDGPGCAQCHETLPRNRIIPPVQHHNRDGRHLATVLKPTKKRFTTETQRHREPTKERLLAREARNQRPFVLFVPSW
jgi:hypothetical protein